MEDTPMFKKLAPAAFAAAMLLGSSVCAAGDTFVTIGTGGITGVYYPTGGAIAKIVNAKKSVYHVRASVESTGGSKFNINAIDARDLDFGIAQADTQYLAYNGKGPWKGKAVKKLPGTCELVVDLQGTAEIVLSNSKGELFSPVGNGFINSLPF
jgi:TRAP transporter TAXI family solute receptor